MYTVQPLYIYFCLCPRRCCTVCLYTIPLEEERRERNTDDSRLPNSLISDRAKTNTIGVEPTENEKNPDAGSSIDRRLHI